LREEEILTIAIPTYNRPLQLAKQLTFLLQQDLNRVCEIVVVNNNSSYDINTLIKQFNNDKIRLVTNPFNIGMSTNMIFPFLYCKTKWIWLLSDDDEVLPDSIVNIYEEIFQCSGEICHIKFSIDRPCSRQKDFTAKSLEELIDFYDLYSPKRRGDFVFISNNVINIDKLQSYIGKSFEFSYSYIGYLIPTIFCLNSSSGYIKFSSKSIVKYLPPKEGSYSFGVVGKGVSILSHLDLNLSGKYIRKFYDLAMPFTYLEFITRVISKQPNFKRDDFIIIYNNIYRYYIPFLGKLFSQLVINKSILSIISFLYSHKKKYN
jgi:hypothetical protein